MTTLPGWEDAGDLPFQQPPIPDHIYKVWGDMAVLCRDHKAGPTWHHREYHAPRSVRESPADISRQRREVVEYVDALASYADRHAPQMTAFDLAVMTAIVFRPGTGFWSRARNAWKVLIG